MPQYNKERRCSRVCSLNYIQFVLSEESSDIVIAVFLINQ